MKLVEFVPPVPHPLWKLCLQMGIADVVVKVNPTLTGLPDPWRFETLKRIVDSLAAAGLRVVALEGDPFDMSPIKEFGARGRKNDEGEGRREEALSHYRELLESMGRLGIPLLCYNFMVGPGWSRTGVREGRGGAKATCFCLAEMERQQAHGNRPGERQARDDKGRQHARDDKGRQQARDDKGRQHARDDKGRQQARDDKGRQQALDDKELLLSAEGVWANYEHFIKSVMPTAERVGVRMGLHPDDPCLDALGGYARIFGSVEAYDRAYAIHPSPSNAVTYCQANFKLMGVDLAETAKHFGKRIAFIHVRDVEGDKCDFTELFHDQGTTDQFALMRTYRELGLDVPVRGDHVPEMEGDRKIVADCVPGYYTLGRLFANGYLKALLKGTSNS